MFFENYKNHIQVDAFSEKISTWEYILIDLRTNQEQEQYGVIEGTQKYIDVYLSNASQELLDLDTSKKYLLYCWHGVRSAQVIDFLKQNKFDEVYDLMWGTDIWEKSGNKLIKK